ncbi:MAG TPA: chromosomal replication initiator protein DnaA [Caldilineaceae bacterium]|nr:chromosomal replication initiator protein DnaA [Caldilineaceae bacterium]
MKQKSTYGYRRDGSRGSQPDTRREIDRRAYFMAAELYAEPELETQAAVRDPAHADLRDLPLGVDNSGSSAGGLQKTQGVAARHTPPSVHNSPQPVAQAEGYAREDGCLGLEAANDFDPHVVWQMVLSELALQMPSATYDTWVRDTVVMGYEDGEFIIGISNAYARDWLENRLRHSIKRTLSSIMRRSVQIQFRVRPRPVQDKSQVEDAPLYQAANVLAAQAPAEPNAGASGVRSPWGAHSGGQEKTVVEHEDERYSSQLNPHHTFETFVVGNHNRLAHAAALAIVDAPGQTFNPLFVYGGVGLGKTHLLNAIGNSLRQRGYRMIYCSSEQFTNELISAIRNQSTEHFRNKYRQVDALLIDDIQFIAGKESTQEEFFHTFNHLHAAGRQVVLSSDRPPKALATLDDRLRSRFEGGLQTDIAQPDFETRVAILQSKANRMGVTVPPDVLMLVAERVDSNIRELEGALNRIFMQARLTNMPVTVQFARTLLEDLAPQRAPCTPAGVIRIVAEHFSLRPEDLTGRKRTKEIANARQIAMYLLREENDLSLPAIGEQLGGRDHSTVRYGVEQVAKELERDEALRLTIMALRDKVYMPVV